MRCAGGARRVVPELGGRALHGEEWMTCTLR